MVELALILFCIVAIPTAVLTWYSGAQVLGESEQALVESSLAKLVASRKLNENALDNMSRNVIRLATAHIFEKIPSHRTFEELSSNYANISNALAVQEELFSLNHIGPGVYSSFFYLNDSDYVVSTDKGVVTLDKYENIGWIQKALARKEGSSGVWYPRKLDTGIGVVSYVLPLNRLSDATQGTIVINLRESQIDAFMRFSTSDEQKYMLMDSEGTIISHNDKKMLLQNGNDEFFIHEILNRGSMEGFAFQEQDNERLLYTWSQSDQLGWTYVNIHSVNEWMVNARSLLNNANLLTIVIIFVGIVLIVLLAAWLSKPGREMVRTLRNSVNLRRKGKNGLALVDTGFKRMQEEKDALHELLNAGEKDACSMVVHNLLRGEPAPQASQMFPAHYFIVAAVSIDRYKKYASKSNPAMRSYHRQLLMSQCDSLFPEEVHRRCIYQGEGCFLILLNYGHRNDKSIDDSIHSTLNAVGDNVAKLMEYSVTIGVSSRAETIDKVSALVAEAMEVAKDRMIIGGGGIAFWKEKDEREKRYIYPANSERRILSFLDQGNLDGILVEVEQISKEIRSAQYISYDNILFIYHQLAGVTIKHLQENNISAAHIFAGRGNIYSTFVSIDTLDELQAYLCEFYREIVQYLERNPGEIKNYGERIVDYLTAHYRNEIVFEEMAKEIGISYSYMRKIVYEITGKSLIDYLNSLRIERAKRLLADSDLDLTIAQVAAEVGYCNVQSFNRFFRKFEAMPPSSYKKTMNQIVK